MLSKLKFALYFIGGIALWGQWKCSSGVMVYQIYTGESTSVFNIQFVYDVFCVWLGTYFGVKVNVAMQCVNKYVLFTCQHHWISCSVVTACSQ